MTTAAAEGRNTEAGRPQAQALDAVRLGDVIGLARLIEAHGAAAAAAAEQPICSRATPLGHAAEAGDSLMVKMLLDAGADPSERSGGHMLESPLARAVRAAQNVTTVRLLLDAGGRPAEGEDLQDHAVLSCDTVMEPHNRILALLLERLPASDAALNRAVDRQAPQWAAQLTAAGADPDVVDARTLHTPMAGALRAPGRNSAETLGPRLLKVLLDAGADPNLRIGGDKDTGLHNPTPLVSAVEHGSAWAVPMLVRAGADAGTARRYIEQHGVRDGGARAHALTALYATG